MGLIQTTEAARRLGVSRQTIVNWAERGVLKIKNIGKTYFVDEDVIAGISDFGQDVENARAALERLKSEYAEETRELERLRMALQIDRKELTDRIRYKNLCAEGSIRSRFFETVINIMQICSILNAREAAILTDSLKGLSLEDISDKFGITPARIYQIVEKAIRKSGELTGIIGLIDSRRKDKEDNEALKATVRHLKEKLQKYEKAERLAAEKALEERKREIAANDGLCSLLSMKITDCNLSVRSLNCLKGQEIETIGDLCKENKSDILKIKHLGWRSLTELNDLLDSLGLDWGMDVDRIYNERVNYLLEMEKSND